MPKLLEHQIPSFHGFGASILVQQTRGRVKRHPLPNDRMQARALLHDHCPLTPGVYGWLDDRNQLCYVGKSKSLRKRLLSYFSKTPVDKKAVRIRQHSQTIVWEPISNELLALIREQELIYRWRPEFNTQGQPTKRQPAFICIGGGLAPNAFFTRRLTNKSEFSFGPIAGTGRLRSAVETINQCFQLRDCPDKIKFKFNNQLSLFENPLTAQCIRFELGTCPGPCAAQCSTRAYQANVKNAHHFILGKDSSILSRLNQQMQDAAASHSFEKAAILRDHISNLNWLDRRMSALRNAQQSFNGVLPIEARKNRAAWLILKAGQLIGSTIAPDSESRAIATIKQLTEASATEKPIPENLMEMNLQLILIAWFRKHPQLKNSLIPFGDAVDICERRLDTGFLPPT